MLTAIAALRDGGIQRIAEILGMDRTTVMAALKPLQRRNLVEVETADDDQRGRSVRLTRAGQKLRDRAIPLWRAQHLPHCTEIVAARAADISDGNAALIRREVAALPLDDWDRRWAAHRHGGRLRTSARRHWRNTSFAAARI